MHTIRKHTSIVALIIVLLFTIFSCLSHSALADRVYGPPSGSDYVLKYKGTIFLFIENRLNYETTRMPLQGAKEAKQGMENMAETLYEDLMDEIPEMEPIAPEDYAVLFSKRWYRIASNSFSNIITTDPQEFESTKLLRIAGDNGYKMNSASRYELCLWKVITLALGLVAIVSLQQ